MELNFIEIGLDPQNAISNPNLIETLTTPSLIKATMIFNVTHNIQLKRSITTLPKRERDQFIMAILLRLQAPIADLIACNQCRLFLKACLLSDIVTGDSVFVSEEAWLGKAGYPQQKDVAWPHMPRPPRSSWGIWQKWITIGFLNRGRRLHYPLGKWLAWDQTWKWYTSPEGDLYSLRDSVWQYHQPVLRRN
jgi:hypothetical protein